MDGVWPMPRGSQGTEPTLGPGACTSSGLCARFAKPALAAGKLVCVVVALHRARMEPRASRTGAQGGVPKSLDLTGWEDWMEPVTVQGPSDRFEISETGHRIGAGVQRSLAAAFSPS